MFIAYKDVVTIIGSAALAGRYWYMDGASALALCGPQGWGALVTASAP